jgi:O-antigen/teichoic acid export membrane protein
MNENIFRIFAALILFTGIGISSYFRRKADRDSGEKISRSVDGSVMMTLIRIGGLVLWLSPLVYLINPHWMVWCPNGYAGSESVSGYFVSLEFTGCSAVSAAALHPRVPRVNNMCWSPPDPIAGYGIRFIQSGRLCSLLLG